LELADIYFPGVTPTPEIMGRAFFREEQIYKRTEAAVQNAIAKVLGEG
jgi:NADH:ubiquinone oxidoreductase subunit B-like Fe-S oxidoreductase